MEEVQVYSEADREEWMALINENTPGEITPHIIDTVVRAQEIALAKLLQKSVPMSDGSLRAELYGGDIVRLKRVEAHQQDAFGQIIQIPNHYAVYVKKHAVSLSILEAALGLPCKNG